MQDSYHYTSHANFLTFSFGWAQWVAADLHSQSHCVSWVRRTSCHWCTLAVHPACKASRDHSNYISPTVGVISIILMTTFTNKDNCTIQTIFHPTVHNKGYKSWPSSTWVHDQGNKLVNNHDHPDYISPRVHNQGNKLVKLHHLHLVC